MGAVSCSDTTLPPCFQLCCVAGNENGLFTHKRLAWIQEMLNFSITETKGRGDKKHNNSHILLSFVLKNSSAKSLQIKARGRLRGLAEEVGFEPTARYSSSIAVRPRPLRAQKAHLASTDIHGYTVSSAGSAVNSAVKKNLLMRGYDGSDCSF